MAEVANPRESGNVSKRRRVGNRKGGKDNSSNNNNNKKSKPFQRTGDKVKKVDGRMKKLYRKRARDYNSDDGDDNDNEEEEEEERERETYKRQSGRVTREESVMSRSRTGPFDKNFGGERKGLDGSDEDNELSEDDVNEDADDEIQPGITKFTEGCRAFKVAFKKIIKKKVSDDSLGPVLSGHKELVAEKLAEDDAERKVKSDAKKEKHLLAERGHAQPANFLDMHEKFLIGVATKGVVKLFNAVNKAQNAQKGLDPSRFKDAKAIKKQRKEAFFSELRKTSSVTNSSKGQTSGDGEGPAWAPLRDNYMLTNSKLKDWDKMPGNAVSNDTGRMEQDSSSDED